MNLRNIRAFYDGLRACETVGDIWFLLDMAVSGDAVVAAHTLCALKVLKLHKKPASIDA